MKLVVAALTLIGLALATALIAYQGADKVFEALATAGAGLLVVTAAHLVPMMCSARAWMCLIPADPDRPPFLHFLWNRWVREGINSLLPVAQIGGEFISARFLIHRGVRGDVAGASVIGDLTVETLTQFLFTMLGLALLVMGAHDERLTSWVAIGLVTATPALIGFVVVQRAGLFKLVDRMLEWLERRWQWFAVGHLKGLHDAVQAMYGRPRALMAASFWHSLSWVIGAIEVWLALYFMGAPAGIREALVIESLGAAVRSAAFPVPGALGVQESGYMLLGTVLGISPEVGLALSLARRVREILLGLPGLFVWQAIEGHRLWRGRSDDSIATPPEAERVP